jgi:hypothetical protein
VFSKKKRTIEKIQTKHLNVHQRKTDKIQCQFTFFFFDGTGV